MRFILETGELDLRITGAIVAGWTGRDRAAVDHHIRELQEIGVPPPSRVPLFYRVSSQLLTQAPEIEVVGPNTSGEVEPLIVATREALYLGLASDHTDRSLETASVAASKQACPKPVAGRLWRLDDLLQRSDGLVIRSWIWEDGGWRVYQEGKLAQIRPLPELVETAAIATNVLADGEAIAMLCGTCPVHGGIRPAARFRMSIVDEVMEREITHSYQAVPLPSVA